ncbi:hypothetical protein HPB49_005771 [Dermacentor silvarum]|uniref:Uncharacterized protein n=1 Tax=Dermacentor silvarum TaxID=543639 RepID=A0ACB8DNA6_DERSI|nr:hypothetical protein HPB49_005771 [Dermacentor silvarum]
MAPKFVTDADGCTTRASKRSQGTQHVATLILRPPTGLFLPQWTPRTLHDALSVSAALTAAEARAATVDITNEKNLAIISSDDPLATEKLQRINETTLNGKTYPVHIYIASPHNSCRGVIHKVELNTPTEELMRELRALNYEIIAARMMGKTSTAIITFKGSHVPRQVIFGGGVYRCVPHRPKAQFCSTCFAIGHRSDVCRDSGKPRCRTCGKTVGDPVDDHDCKPGCPYCGKDHKADDPTCEVRQAADKAVREAAYLKRLQQREDDKQTNSHHRKPKPTPKTQLRQHIDRLKPSTVPGPLSIQGSQPIQGPQSIQGPQPIQGPRPVRGPQPVWELQQVREPRPVWGPQQARRTEPVSGSQPDPRPTTRATHNPAKSESVIRHLPFPHPHICI